MSLSLPTVTVTQESKSRFRVRSIDRSVLNAIRRTVLTDIPYAAMVHGTGPYRVNTSRHTNAFLSERLRLLPVCLPDLTPATVSSYYVELDVQCPVGATEWREVTSHDLVLMTSAGRVDDTLQREVFPANQTHNTYFTLLYLNPGEHISFTCPLELRTGNHWTAGCNLYDTMDQEAVEKQKGRSTLTGMELSNWERIEAKRIVLPNDFTLEVVPIGYGKQTHELVVEACQILATRVERLATDVEHKTVRIVASDHTLSLAWDVLFPTYVGYSGLYMLQYVFHHLMEQTYCGVVKTHPHDGPTTQACMRLAFSDGGTAEHVHTLLLQACTVLRTHLIQIQEQFSLTN